MNSLYLLSFLSLGLGLLTWGAHALLPWPSETTPSRLQHRWRLMALPFATLTLLAGAARYLLWPDPAFGAGLYPPSSSRLMLITSLLAVVIFAADGLLLVGGAKLERLGWQLLGGFGCAILLVSNGYEQLWAIGAGPSMRPTTFAFAVLCRVVFGLACAEGLRPRSYIEPRRFSWALSAAIASLAYWWCLPVLVRQALGPGAMTALGAAGLLWLVASRLPSKARIAAYLGALILISFFLAECAALSQHLGELGRT